MIYEKIIPAIFIRRPNRFIAEVEIAGNPVRVHVKNTGRCRELLIPGCRVYLTPGKNPERKTPYDLIAVEKGDLLINMDSQVVNDVAEEWLKKQILIPGLTVLRREVTFGNSRFDFYFEAGRRKGFIEVKGVTLEEGRIASFPDAPTERGVKHIEELIKAAGQGFEARLLFVVQMSGMKRVRPNDETHPEFGTALRMAAGCGVKVTAAECFVEPGSIRIIGLLPVEL